MMIVTINTWRQRYSSEYHIYNEDYHIFWPNHAYIVIITTIVVNIFYTINMATFIIKLVLLTNNYFVVPL